MDFKTKEYIKILSVIALFIVLFFVITFVNKNVENKKTKDAFVSLNKKIEKASRLPTPIQPPMKKQNIVTNKKPKFKSLTSSSHEPMA